MHHAEEVAAGTKWLATEILQRRMQLFAAAGVTLWKRESDLSLCFFSCEGAGR